MCTHRYTHRQLDTELIALKSASKALDLLMAEHKVNIEEVVEEFKTARNNVINKSQK